MVCSHVSPPEPQPEQKNTPAEHHGVLAAAVRIISGLTLLSRFFGLARDVLTARIFEDSALGSAFRAAYAVPNLFRRLFGEGALSAAFLPEYARLIKTDRAAADGLASLVVWTLTAVTGGVVVVIEGVLLARLLLFPAEEASSLSIRLMMLMLPMMPMVCITAILGGMLQSHGRFAVPAAAPVLLNLAQIAAGLAFLFGVVRDREAGAFAVGAAAVGASVLQIVWSLLALRGLWSWSGRFGPAREQAREHARTVLKRFLPVVIGLGAIQLNTMMDTVIAMWPTWVGPTIFGRAVPLDEASNAILGYTQTLYQFPLGVFGIAVATAVFPMLARSADQPEEFTRTLHRGLRLSLFIGLPASVGLLLVRHDLVTVVFGGGKAGFSADGLSRAAAVLAGFASAVWAYSLNHVFARAFYARGDTRTPMRISLFMVALNLCLNLSLIWLVREAGLAWATAIAATVQTALLARMCRTRLGITPIDRPTLAGAGRTALASAIMGLAVFAVLFWWPLQATGWLGHAARMGACVAVGGLVFAISARALRMPELSWLLQRGPRAGASGMSLD